MRNIITRNDMHNDAVEALTKRIVELEAALALGKYNVEFLKNQGRKSRGKTRAIKQGYSQARNHLSQALDRAERAERFSEQYARLAGR
ncbi:hypothetical protein [Agrobacterium salinitolerans]|uniref:hypothetical protein n=1 Tax=Agrobacterium salinitolerans TaxID=1183413 RepID=UPI0022B83B7C|nr:hypothetical protein [Agrobacterium salinitolerans]MCZ7854736.1 hypothetical protein [Agrobacterium salinitolerans]MCZ7973384.1 hypothetical protein [Agrobacterium salinitolerans]